MKSAEKSFIQQRAMHVFNRFSVLAAIAGGMRTRRQIQNAAGLSWGTVSSCVRELAAENILTLSPELPENAFTVFPAADARNSYCFFNREKHLLAGVSVSADHLDLEIVTPDRETILSHTLQTGFLPDAAALKQALIRLFEETATAPEKIAYSVIALTGAFDRTGKIWLKTPHLPQVDKWDLAILSDSLPGEVIFEHDIISKARSVMMKRQDSGNDSAFIHWGNGIGLTICREGKFQEGHRGFAGEIGHLPYPAANNSTLETCASLTAAEVFAQKRQCPLDSPEVWEFLKPHILWCLSAVAGLFDPEVIVLGGEVPDLFPEKIGELSAELEKISWIPIHNELRFYSMNECNTASGAAFAAGEVLLANLAEMNNCQEK
ncbi:MAG: ROK family protein [Lentisphaerae bacterium]|nr:ROK family protein [Lentisphaerota bacterium]